MSFKGIKRAASLLITASAVFAAGAVFAQGDVTVETGYAKVKDPSMYGTVVMEKNIEDTTRVRPVLFPHWAHRPKYTCNVCHTDLGFAMKAGDTVITQAEIEEGRFCGSCHDGQTAFGSSECIRCHSKDLPVRENRKLEDVLHGYPEDDFGNRVDWVAAMTSGAMTPDESLDGKKKLESLDTEIVIPAVKLKPAPPDVLFPHKAHTETLECANCHDSIFKQKEGGNPDMNMMKIMYGQYCGVCHGRVAFPLENCFRCHSQPVKPPKEIEDIMKEREKAGKKPAED